MAKTRTFSDIDLSFNPHPATKDLVAKYDDAAIKTAVKNLILTTHYERPFHSELGSSVKGLLFEIASPALVAIIKQEIANVIQNFEPRVVLLDVQVQFSADENEITITVIFKIVNTERPITLQFTLDRTR
jgi:phage baseplate assembly protein W